MSSSTAASSASTGAAASRTIRPGWTGRTSALIASAMLPPSSASTPRANETPPSGGCSVATSAAETAACWANIWPDPSSSATDIASATTSASCHQPVPSPITSRSAIAIPSVTPSTTSTARRPRSPCVRPSVIIADTGAKNGRECPTASVATSQAIVAASVAWRIARAVSRSRSARTRAETRDRSAASPSSGWARSENVRGGSATPPMLRKDQRQVSTPGCVERRRCAAVLSAPATRSVREMTSTIMAISVREWIGEDIRSIVCDALPVQRPVSCVCEGSALTRVARAGRSPPGTPLRRRPDPSCRGRPQLTFPSWREPRAATAQTPSAQAFQQPDIPAG